MVSVPKVTGMRLMFSRRRLEVRGLLVGRLSYARDEDHMETFVLSQSPQPGTEAPRGSAVDMVINRVE
jgi:beta-lactam-binding protein with PASTA domain